MQAASRSPRAGHSSERYVRYLGQFGKLFPSGSAHYQFFALRILIRLVVVTPDGIWKTFYIVALDICRGAEIFIIAHPHHIDREETRNPSLAHLS